MLQIKFNNHLAIFSYKKAIILILSDKIYQITTNNYTRIKKTMKQILILVAILLAMLSIVNGMPLSPSPRDVSTETRGLPTLCDECKNPPGPYF